MEAKTENSINVEVQNDSFRISSKYYLIIITRIEKDRWNYDFYKVPDTSNDTSKMSAACAPFEANGLPWIQNRYKDSLFVNCMNKIFIDKKEKTQELVQEIISKINDVSDDYVNLQLQSINNITSGDQTETQEEQVPEDIINEANKIISDKRVKEFVLDHLNHTYIGDIPFKNFMILSTSSIGVANCDTPLHVHAWGSPESGKTTASDNMIDLLPDILKLPYEDLSPKAIYYLREKLHSNIIIAINDKIIDDNFADILNKVCDSHGWERGTKKAIPVDGNTIELVIPPRVLWWITTNKTIPEYKTEHSQTDYGATASRFYSTKKEYTDEEKKAIKKHKFFLKLPDNYEHNREVIKQIFRTLLSQPKYIEQSKDYNRIDKICTPGIRESGRVYTLLKCNALLRGSSKVEDIDIDTIEKLLRDVESSEAELTRETPEILKNLLADEDFFTIYNSTNNLYKDQRKFVDAYNRDGISKSTGIGKSSLYNKLKSLSDKGIIDSKNVSGAKSMYVYYKLRGNSDNIPKDIKLQLDYIITTKKDLEVKQPEQDDKKQKEEPKKESVIITEKKYPCRVCKEEFWRTELYFEPGKYNPETDGICFKCKYPNEVVEEIED